MPASLKNVSKVFTNPRTGKGLVALNDVTLQMEEGVNVSAKLVTGGIEAAYALMNGAVDQAAMGDAPAVQFISNNDDVRMVARLMGGAGVHRFIAWNDIVDPKDLEGMRVGLQQTSNTHGAFLQWCDANQVNMDIKFVYLPSPRDLPLAMQTRDIDAMAGSEP